MYRSLHFCNIDNFCFHGRFKKVYQFFLIRNKFQIDLQTADVTVYTDEVWFVYILDHILSNAVKYAKPEGEHHVRFRVEKYYGEAFLVRLYVEDNGEGIRESDIRRVFEKGYTGSGYHNGRYKSTGMGLYMAGKLGHEISVESRCGEYTRFCIALRGK